MKKTIFIIFLLFTFICNITTLFCKEKPEIITTAACGFVHEEDVKLMMYTVVNNNFEATATMYKILKRAKLLSFFTIGEAIYIVDFSSFYCNDRKMHTIRVHRPNERQTYWILHSMIGY